MMSWLALGFLLLGLGTVAADEPRGVLETLEAEVVSAIDGARPSVVAITRIRSEDGATLAVRGLPLPAVPGEMDIDRGGGITFGGVAPIRPGFPSERSPEFYALPGETGSGVVVGGKGEILTAFHLVKGARRIRVRSEKAEFDAEIIAADPRTDLAVIVPRPGSTLPEALKPLAIGKGEALRQGAFLLALGNPFNAARDGQATASLGILANVARRIEPPQGDNPNVRQFFQFQPTLLQLDSKLNLGMSGGAVVNLKGELVGITTAEASPSGFDAAAGYAIPMDARGRKAVGQLIEGKEVEYGFIGIGLEREPNMIREVRRGTPAWKAELAAEDVILAVGDVTLAKDESALPLALAGAPVGEPVKLKVLHEGRVVQRTLIMSKYPVSGEVIVTNRPEPWRGLRIDFTSVLGDALSTQETLDSMMRGGVGVVEVLGGSNGESAGVLRGDVVASVEGTLVNTPAEFRAAVSAFEDKPVTLKLRSGLDEERTVTVAPR